LNKAKAEWRLENSQNFLYLQRLFALQKDAWMPENMKYFCLPPKA